MKSIDLISELRFLGIVLSTTLSFFLQSAFFLPLTQAQRQGVQFAQSSCETTTDDKKKKIVRSSANIRAILVEFAHSQACLEFMAAVSARDKEISVYIRWGYLVYFDRRCEKFGVYQGIYYVGIKLKEQAIYVIVSIITL